MINFLFLLLLLGASASCFKLPQKFIMKGEVSCESPFQEVGGRCMYVDILNKGTWSVMRNHCKSLGGDLVKLNDGEVYAALIRHIHGNGFPIDYYWIGATDEGHEGLWVWIDQEPVQMGTPYWANCGCDNDQMPTGGTAQNCALLDAHFHLYFNDGTCSQEANVICEQ
ncbi:C-type lectin 37Db-like [Cherax quadricarinatus]|uniref:C-type lectin 37Db-like n=1 Tax=Cherax quadricarinatus TaxID=27406 RepID=UPI00387EE2C5